MNIYTSSLSFPKCGLSLSSLSYSNIIFVVSKFFPSFSTKQKFYFIFLVLVRIHRLTFSKKLSYLTLSSKSTQHIFVLTAGISFKITKAQNVRYLRSAACYLPQIPDIHIIYAQDSLLITSTPIYHGETLSWRHRSIPTAFLHALSEINQLTSTPTHCQLENYISSLLASSNSTNRFYLSRYLNRLSLILNSSAQLALSHGDLKPQNIVQTFDPLRPFKLLDWELVDVRSLSHDAFNILIHYLVEYSSPPPRAIAVSFVDFCSKYLPSIEQKNCYQLLKLSLFEKLYLYLESGKWPFLEQRLFNRLDFCCSFIESHEFFAQPS